MKALRSTRTPERRAALLGLSGRSLTPAVRTAVEQVLRTDVDPGTRGLAADALGRAAKAGAAQQLRLSVQQDSSWVVRTQALRALVSALGPLALEDIQRSLASDPHPTVRVEAINLAVRTLEPRQAARLIAEGLRDSSAPVKLNAYTWLRQIVGPENIPPEDYDRWKEAIEQATKLRDVRSKQKGPRLRQSGPAKP